MEKKHSLPQPNNNPGCRTLPLLEGWVNQRQHPLIFAFTNNNSGCPTLPPFGRVGKPESACRCLYLKKEQTHPKENLAPMTQIRCLVSSDSVSMAASRSAWVNAAAGAPSRAPWYSLTFREAEAITLRAPTGDAA